MQRGVYVALALLALFAVAKADFLNVEAGTLFGYDDNEKSIPGPSTWSTLSLSEVCGAGKRQSPIDIPSIVPMSRSNGPLTLAYKPSLVNVGNNGHAFVISSRSRYLEHSMIFVQNLVYAPLGYRLFQMHFHWGRNNSEGSEHTLNGQAYPLEAHFVHYNSRFASIDAAVRSGDQDALIVIGIFFQVGATTPPSITSILNQLPYYTSVQQETEIQEYINLADMFPKGLEYYTYLGSFTTPRCNEVNRWLVLARPVPIMQADLDKIRSVNIVLSSTRTGPGKNFRPLQPLNGRKITASFNSLPYIQPPAAPAPPPGATPTPVPSPQDPGNNQPLEG